MGTETRILSLGYSRSGEFSVILWDEMKLCSPKRVLFIALPLPLLYVGQFALRQI
jgi:hypothetical protein